MAFVLVDWFRSAAAYSSIAIQAENDEVKFWFIDAMFDLVRASPVTFNAVEHFKKAAQLGLSVSSEEVVHPF